MDQQVVDILFLISKISYGIAVVSAAALVFLWFRLKIPAVINDLSGRAARKSIAKTRAHNEKSGNKSFRPSETNVNRGLLTGTMGTTEKKRGVTKKHQRKKPVAATELQELVETGLLKESADNEMTGLLNGAEADAPLSGETALLNDPDATAPLLNQDHAPVKRTGGKKIELLEEVILIHTKEQIV